MRFYIVLAFIVTFLILSSSSGFSGEKKTTPNGLKYQFHLTNPTADKPKLNDFLKVIMVYSINDSVLFDSRTLQNNLQLQLVEPNFMGDFFEGVAMMHKGDSASFWSPADSIMLKIFNTGVVPPFVNEGDDMRFDIKMLDFISPEEFEQHREQQNEAIRIDADRKLLAYVRQQNITINSSSSGLYYIEIEEGQGAMPQAGQRISVHYSGTLLDGTMFDSSYERGKPIEFTLGIGQVIPGWDEGIARMRAGGKAKLIIPYDLAYGERDMGVIPPYSPLIFEVELIEIID